MCIFDMSNNLKHNKMQITSENDLYETVEWMNSGNHLGDIKEFTAKAIEYGAAPIELHLSQVSNSTYIVYEYLEDDELVILKVRFSDHSQRSGDCDVCTYGISTIELAFQEFTEQIQYELY